MAARASLVATSLVVGALAVVARPAPAQEARRPLSLAAAVEIGLARNPLLGAARQEVEVASAGIDRARAGFLPRLDVSDSYTRADDPVFAFGSKLSQGRFRASDFDVGRLNDPGATGDFHLRLSLAQPLYTGGKASLGLARARLGREATEQGLDRRRQEIVYEVTRAYRGVQLAQAQLAVVQAALRAARANRDLARARFDGGLVVQSDVLSAEVRGAELREQEIVAASRVVLARAALNDAMGLPLDEPWEPTEDLGDPVPLDARPEALEDEALEARPDHRRLGVEERALEQSLRLARAEYLPTVSATASYDVHRHDLVANGQDGWFVGVAVQWNLFNGLADRARVAEARAELERVRAIRARAASAIRLEVRDAYLAVRSAGERVGVARQAVTQAEESLRVVQDRYGAGLTTIVTLLAAETALAQAQGGLSAALHDHGVARARLDLATGRSGKERPR